MTEYDYSPEAVERHIHKQHAISKWVRKTEEGPMRDPHTPATPAPNTYPLDNVASDQDGVRRHRSGQSHDQYNRHRDRDFDRHRDRDKERGVGVDNDRDRHNHKAHSLHHSSRPPNTKRHRSASQSATLQSVQRSHVPPPLPLPPQPWQMPYSQRPFAYPQYYPPKLTSPRDSKRSSHSSSTTRLHSPNSYFPQSSPHHSPDTSHGYPQPSLRKGSSRVPDFANAPQYPHSIYHDQVKPPPTLFQRLLKGLTGGNKQVPQRVPRRKRSSSL